MTCPSCHGEVLDIDVRCGHCGAALGATGAHRMLGQIVLGHYELVDVLGQGGMSVVFKGRHRMTEQEVALKVLPPELAAHSQVKSRFVEEAKALAALDHPNIVHLYNFGQENGCFALAMQYVQGKTWERMILERKRLDWQLSCKLAIDVLRALEYAHGRGVIHRDMKPSNVLVRSHDGMATVMDFGIAKMTTSTKLTATGQTMGTVRYMSPEQVRGQEVDPRTDIYSLGATLYESLTGDTPFDGNTHFEIMTKHLSEAPRRPTSLGVDVPQSVEDALMRALAKKPAERFEDAREMRMVLEAALREGELGLVETQRLAREAPRVATATDGLADDLEPATRTDSVASRRGTRKLLWIALAVLASAAGTIGAFSLFGRPAGYTPIVTNIAGYRPTAGGRFGAVVIETSGKVAPAEVASMYEGTLAALRERARAREIEIPDPVDEIVAVPQLAMCEPSAYLDRRAPAGCERAAAVAVIGPRGQHRLLVVDEPARLAHALAVGVADAVCIFDPGDRATKEGQERWSTVCEITEELKPRAPE